MSEKFSSSNIKQITNCSAYNDKHFFCVDCLENPVTRESCALCRPFFSIPDDVYDGISNNYFMEKLEDLHQLFVEKTLNITREKQFGKTTAYLLVFACYH